MEHAASRDEENLYETAHKTPSFHSVSSTDSGIDLDEITRTSIINRSSLIRARRMESRGNLGDENSMEHAASRDDENLHETAHKTPSFYSASSTDSGIDLDEKTRTSIIDRSIILDSCQNQSINLCQKNEKQEKPQRRKFNRARCLAIFEPTVISVRRICFIQSLCKRK